ncbi:TIGR03084 family metal-binding protein [Actinophytocola sp. NPDC049390]|uniref:TIGR03084 family metal-binding protein n=1 Tax=Actinophytocola sp. NPDC049390 TaxID=3363894 RepID=UPI00378E9DEE
MVELNALVADLRAEGDEIDALVRDLAADGWARPTPAAGWTVAHQIAHLAWTDERALLAATDPAGFQAEFAEHAAQAADGLDGIVDAEATRLAQRPDLLDWWRAGRERLAVTLLDLPEGTKLPWYGPPMSAASMATARLMETWAHGQDVADAVGARRTPTARLRHVAHIGVRTRDFAYLVRGKQPPAEAFRVELMGPGEELWTWGPEDASQRVTGPALEFCLLVTQRVHRADTALVAVGDDANAWLDIAQAFAGPPGKGREVGSRG